jgi:hypothetical protein
MRSLDCFSLSNLSSRTVALGFTLPLTEMSSRNLHGVGGKALPGLKADKFTVISEPIVHKMWDHRRLTALQASTACYRDNFTFFTL